MADEAFAPFMFAIVFLAVGITLIGACARFVSSNAQETNAEVLEGYDIVGGLAYQLWTPTDGINVTTIYQYNTDWVESNDAAYDWDVPPQGLPSPPSATFHPPGESSHTSDIKLWVVMNNTGFQEDDRHSYWLKRPTGDTTHDFIYVRQGYKSGWFHDILHYKVAVVPFTDIESQYDNATNMSAISFNLRHNVTLMLETTGDNTWAANLYNGNISVAIGHQYGSDEVKKTSFWTTLSQLLTARLPGIHPVLNFAISIPFWIAVGYVAVVIVRSFIPFL